jgi:hypothetical protein
MYEYPIIYTLSHLTIGGISYKYPLLIIFIIIYQLSQYILNVRFFFLNKGNILDNGNSISHTLYKLFEYGVGYVLVYIYYKFILSNVNLEKNTTSNL